MSNLIEAIAQWMKRPWAGADSSDRLGRALLDAARDGQADRVDALVKAGAKAGAKGWRGRDALCSAMGEMHPQAHELARALAPISDPAVVDDAGQGALILSMGAPISYRTIPLSGTGFVQPWAAAFWILLPWADCSGEAGWAAMARACEVQWPDAAAAIGERVDWADPRWDGVRARALSLALLESPEAAQQWAAKGLGAVSVWREAAQLAAARAGELGQLVLSLREAAEMASLPRGEASETPRL